MIKAFFKILIFLILLIGTLSYVYQKYGYKIDNYLDERWENVLNGELENFSKSHNDYSDSVKVFVENILKKYKQNQSGEVNKKFEQLKKTLKKFAEKKFIDSSDFLAIKKIFE